MGQGEPQRDGRPAGDDRGGHGPPIQLVGGSVTAATDSPSLAIPAGIHAYLADRIARCVVGPGRDPGSAIDALPGSLPAGRVRKLVGGGPFGWVLYGRLDEEEGRLALEVLEDDRMGGPDHYRVWEDGTREELDTESGTMVFPAGCSPDEEERIKQAFYEHNHRVQALLSERGFI